MRSMSVMATKAASATTSSTPTRARQPCEEMHSRSSMRMVVTFSVIMRKPPTCSTKCWACVSMLTRCELASVLIFKVYDRIFIRIYVFGA
jgi:hypothetical protein